MSNHMSPEERLELLSSISNTSGEFEGNFTATRPPQYNDSNQPSGRFLHGGLSAVPRTLVTMSQAPQVPTPSQLEDVGQHYPSSDSTGTVMADEVAAAAAAAFSQPRPGLDPVPRMHILFHINRDYNGAVLPLTERAVAALNHDFAHGSGNGNVDEWIHGRSQFSPADQMDPSMSVLRHPRTRTVTRTGSTVASSWSAISSSTLRVSLMGHVADDVCATGLQFADVSVPIGNHLLDEDLM
ncbi:hypothetical protein E0Z10_g234 [Xylaria hypoxylon]|uniref:Uncharacterized protein n=1 Tax=Xylaria hypoxylon TaxID=37992 RepID=A0A4Z0Z8D5_9PEZI|nr:hypothetical protein E0Z10_g234 [Xylaria hypoxylon]